MGRRRALLWTLNESLLLNLRTRANLEQQVVCQMPLLKALLFREPQDAVQGLAPPKDFCSHPYRVRAALPGL